MCRACWLFIPTLGVPLAAVPHAFRKTCVGDVHVFCRQIRAHIGYLDELRVRQAVFLNTLSHIHVPEIKL